ncbi:hypothetical protein JCM16106_20310 [Hydrogenophilus islandicus]
MFKTPGDFDEDVAFYAERLSWYDFVDEANLNAYNEWGWAVVDEEVLKARSALELLRNRISDDHRALLDAADRQWRAHPAAFDAMFRVAIAKADLATTLAEWVRDEEGRPVPVPPSHWWWRTSDKW